MFPKVPSQPYIASALVFKNIKNKCDLADGLPFPQGGVVSAVVFL